MRHGELLKLQIIPHLQEVGNGVGARATEVKADGGEVIVEAADEDERVV